MTITRRGFMQSILALAAAPAIIKIANLMPVVTPRAIIIPEAAVVAPKRMAHFFLREFVGFGPTYMDVTTLCDSAKIYARGIDEPIYREREVYADIDDIAKDYDFLEIMTMPEDCMPMIKATRRMVPLVTDERYDLYDVAERMPYPDERRSLIQRWRA